MSKLTKPQIAAHKQACELLRQDVLSEDDRWFVLENWQESATHINSAAGAFFTPLGLARDFRLEVHGRRILDLCAGIGTLSFFLHPTCWDDAKREIVCVDNNPDYVSVGRKIVPEATWIEADVFALPNLGHFDCVIANPPFGGTARSKSASPRYRGREFEYHLIDIASDLGDAGVFIVPQMSAPFSYSGRQDFRISSSTAYAGFERQTAIQLSVGIPIDTSAYRNEWRGAAPTTEIVHADFHKARSMRGDRRNQAAEDLPLFSAGEAA